VEVDKSGTGWQLSDAEIFHGQTSVPAIPGRVAYCTVGIGRIRPDRRGMYRKEQDAYIQLNWHSYLNRRDSGIYTRRNRNEFNGCDIRPDRSEHPQARPEEILTNHEAALPAPRRDIGNFTVSADLK